MSDRNDFLNALFGGFDGPYEFDVGDESVVCFSPDEVKALLLEPGVYVRDTQQKKITFFWKFSDAEDHDLWMGLKPVPSAVLESVKGVIAIWALGAPIEATERAVAYGQTLDPDFRNKSLPLPGTNGWGLVQANANVFYTLDDLIRVRGTEEKPAKGSSKTVSNPDTPLPDLGLYGDATIRREYDDTLYDQEMIVSIGANSESKNWKSGPIPVGAMVAKLCTREAGPKDGRAFVYADMVAGRRTNNNVISGQAIVLDLDSGEPADEIDAKLLNFPCLAVRYPTHSNGATRTLFLRDTVTKKTGVSADEITTEVLRQYLLEHKGWDSRLVETVEYDGTEHVEGGINVVALHAPMPKNRVFIPLASPYVVADEGATQRDAQGKWKNIVLAFAAQVDLRLDTAAIELARIFFPFRSPKGSTAMASVFGGPLFDWRSVDLDAPSGDMWEAEAARVGGGEKGRPNSKGGPSTDAGKTLGRWAMKHAHGFQIATAVEDYASDRIRSEKGPGQLEVECPFDENHSNAGDPEDVAFFVVNAGDGQGDTFFARCRHESCQDKNNLDMLAKMIADGWLPEDVINDERYDDGEIEDAPNPAVAKRIEKEDKAKKGYIEAVEALTRDSDADERTNAIRLILEADLNPIEKSTIKKQVKDKLKLTVAEMAQAFNFVQRTIDKENNAKKDSKKKKLNQRLFEYDGGFHFHEAVACCHEELENANIDSKTNKWDKPNFTCLNGELVQLQWNMDKTRISFNSLSVSQTWAELTAKLAFVRISDGVQGTQDKVPEDVAKVAFELAYTMLPPTPEVVYTPCFTKSGKLITEPRWYTEDGDNILLVDTGFKIDEVSEDPTIDEVEEAVDWLCNELLGEFKFLDVDLKGVERVEPSLANALAMFITPFMRRMIVSPAVTPVFFITKPQPGVGGTLLGNLPIIMFDGQNASPLTYTSSEEEMNKVLVSAMMETKSHLFFDDVKEFNNRVLLRTITTATASGRILGSSKNIERPNNWGWIATGNNPIIGTEMDRRICWVRMNPKTKDVQKRSFKKRYIKEAGKDMEVGFSTWAIATRGKTVWAILTLIQNWVKEGQPSFTDRSLTSFEEWAKKVGGVLQYAGIEGFLDNRATVFSDFEEASIQQFVQMWYNDKGQTPHVHKELFDMAMNRELDIIEGNNDDQKRVRFYKRLESLAGRVFEVAPKVEYMVHRAVDSQGNPAFGLKPLEEAIQETGT